MRRPPYSGPHDRPALFVNLWDLHWLLAFLVGFVVLSVLGIALGVGQLFGFADPEAVAGVDVFGKLEKGEKVASRPESGRRVRVTILGVEAGPAVVVTALADGFDEFAVLPETWQIYLDGGSRRAMDLDVLRVTGTTVEVRVTATLSPGERPRFLHVNADPSRGDIYLEWPK